MVFYKIKSCESCVKTKVCKFVNDKKDLEYDIEDKVILGVYDKGYSPFNLTLSCDEWDNGNKSRNELV